MNTRNSWEEVFRRFDEENSPMNATDFYAGDRFGLLIDLRSTRDNNLRGSGLKRGIRKKACSSQLTGKQRFQEM